MLYHCRCCSLLIRGIMRWLSTEISTACDNFNLFWYLTWTSLSMLGVGRYLFLNPKLRYVNIAIHGNVTRVIIQLIWNVYHVNAGHRRLYYCVGLERPVQGINAIVGKFMQIFIKARMIGWLWLQNTRIAMDKFLSVSNEEVTVCNEVSAMVNNKTMNNFLSLNFWSQQSFWYFPWW